MKYIKLSTDQGKQLIGKRETGMGYQRVDLELTDGEYMEDAGIVVNARTLILEDSIPVHCAESIRFLTVRAV